MIELRRYVKEDNILWDETVKKSKNGLFLFYRAYMDYHSDRFTDHSIIIYKNNKVLALFPANESDDTIYSHGGLTYGSLIMTLQIKAVEVLEVLNLIKSFYKNIGFKKVIYKAIPSIFHKYPSEEDLYALFMLNANMIRRDISSVVEIKNRIKFSESKRQAISRCEKLNVEVAESIDFSEYWSLLTEVLEKFDTKPVHSLEEIMMLRKLFPDNIKLFVARMNGKLLAGIITYNYGHVIHTQYMANSQEGRKVGALDFINHKLIDEFFLEKKYYSFGISTEDFGRKLNEGLIQQKEMMGGRGIAIDFYEISLDN